MSKGPWRQFDSWTRDDIGLFLLIHTWPYKSLWQNVFGVKRRTKCYILRKCRRDSRNALKHHLLFISKCLIILIERNGFTCKGDHSILQEFTYLGGGCRIILRVFELIIVPYLLYVIGQIGLSKQCRPKSGAVERGVWSGSTLFATHTAEFHWNPFRWSGRELDSLQRHRPFFSSGFPRTCIS